MAPGSPETPSSSSCSAAGFPDTVAAAGGGVAEASSMRALFAERAASFSKVRVSRRNEEPSSLESSLHAELAAESWRFIARDL